MVTNCWTQVKHPLHFLTVFFSNNSFFFSLSLSCQPFFHANFDWIIRPWSREFFPWKKKMLLSLVLLLFQRTNFFLLVCFLVFLLHAFIYNFLNSFWTLKDFLKIAFDIKIGVAQNSAYYVLISQYVGVVYVWFLGRKKLFFRPKWIIRHYYDLYQ